jgi:hypothetical protein
VVTVALLPGTAVATHVPDQSFKMDELFTSPNQATNSDFAFWGKYAFSAFSAAEVERVRWLDHERAWLDHSAEVLRMP